MNQIRTIILAAGRGKRMQSDTPKVLHCICGKPLIEYSVDIFNQFGSKTYIVLGYGAEKIISYLGAKFSYIVQKKLLGTADAVKAAKKHFQKYSGDILITCGDMPFLKRQTIAQLIRVHQKSRSACTILSAIVENPKGYGRVIRDADNRPISICEESDARFDQKSINEINTGIYVFNAKDLFSALGKVSLNARKQEYYLTDVIGVFSRNKKKIQTFTIVNSQESLGINNREDLAKAEAMMRKEIVQQKMKQGVTFIDTKTAYIDTDVKIGRDTTIFPCVVIEKNVVIGKKCTVGPFARLRSGTRIKNGVQVGNFTEISRTHVDSGCVMKHFGFLGDAKIGKRVNIGAGTVTANYDGKNKSITKICDDAFIGSDTVIVAPALIGKKAKTGAGCVIPQGKKVPCSSVIMGVPGRIKERKERT